MYVPPSHPLSQHLLIFDQHRVSKLDRLKCVCSCDDLYILNYTDSVLKSRLSTPTDKCTAFSALLNQFIQYKNVTENQLLRVFDYLLEYFPGTQMTIEHRAHIVACIFMFCLRNYKEQLDCDIYQQAIVDFATFLHIHDHRDLWEEGIAHAIQHINITYQLEFDYLLLFLQMGVDLIFHSRKENRDIWDEGPQQLVKDGIGKRLCFQIAKILPDKNVALAFIQVYVSRNTIMVYTQTEIDYLLNLMNSCKCSLYSIINMKHIMLAGTCDNSLPAYSFFYACLKSLSQAKLISLNDAENQFAMIHQEFNQLDIHKAARVKLLEAMSEMMLNSPNLDSVLSIHEIDTVYSEFATLFKIVPDWMEEAKEICLKYYKTVCDSKFKEFGNFFNYLEITVKTLLGQEPHNQAKINFYVSGLCIQLAVEISGAHFKSAHKHEAFDSKLIIRLVEKSLCSLENYPNQLNALKQIIRNPRLSTAACVAIMELLVPTKKPIAHELAFLALEKFVDPEHVLKQTKLTLSQFTRMLKVLLDSDLGVSKSVLGKEHAQLIARFLSTKWNFDTIFPNYDKRHKEFSGRVHAKKEIPFLGKTISLATAYCFDGKSAKGKEISERMDRDPYYNPLEEKETKFYSLFEIYLGSEAKTLYDFTEVFGLVDKINYVVVVSTWMDALVEKIVDLRTLKMYPGRLRPVPLLSLKRELLNLLHDYCKVIETLRIEMKHEMKHNKDGYYTHLYERPQTFLSRLDSFRLYLPVIDEPEVKQIQGEYVLAADHGDCHPLLKITHKEDL